MNEIKEYLESFHKLLNVGSKSISFAEAERRSGEFLLAMAKVTDYRHQLSDQKIALLSTQTAVYAELISKGTAKTITENKLTAEASPEYTLAREDLERVENDLSYLRAYYDIFNNAHVFFRQLAKGENQ